MIYALRLLGNTVGAILWPPAWWQRVWHGLIAAGASLAPEIRKLFEASLNDAGLSGVENWHYYLSAAAAASLTLAFRTARLTTRRVRFNDFRITRDEGRYYCKLTITNDTANHLHLLADMRVITPDNNRMSIKGQDRFVLLTQQKLMERRIISSKDVERKRFNLGEYESKDLEFLVVTEDLSSMMIHEELREVLFPMNDYRLEISVSGGGVPARVTVTMKRCRGREQLDLTMRLPMMGGSKKLSLPNQVDKECARS